MARGSKDYDKVVRKVNKGAKSKAKINSIQKMVEALINGDVDAAEEELSEYIRMTSREILLGEAADEDDSDDSEGKMTDDKEDDDSDDDEDEDSDDSDDEDDSDEDDDSDDEDDSDDDSETIKEDVTDDKVANTLRALKAVQKKLKADKSTSGPILNHRALINDDIRELQNGKVTGLSAIEKDILKAEKFLSK